MFNDNLCCGITDNVEKKDDIFGLPISTVLFIIIVLAVILLAGLPNYRAYGCYGGNYTTPGFLFTPQLDEMYRYNKHYKYAPDGFL